MIEIYREALNIKYFPLEDVFITGQAPRLKSGRKKYFSGLAVNRTSLRLFDLPNFLSDKNLSHAFRGGREYVSYHGLNVTSMYSFWYRYLASEIDNKKDFI